ncbi:DUF3519 domain-containing protein [Helicobacter sp. 16-1353]|uniref:putative barnase/colicin E5 family endoribonuclease n=1 Tax=Helicobacter sp. 16-1353 TaxID=2004996 RepID=UPI00215C4EA8|nr:DUF3519 domain-containing protein [Helicobacter sp. 16-1353]
MSHFTNSRGISTQDEISQARYNPASKDHLANGNQSQTELGTSKPKTPNDATDNIIPQNPKDSPLDSIDSPTPKAEIPPAPKAESSPAKPKPKTKSTQNLKTPRPEKRPFDYAKFKAEHPPLSSYRPKVGDPRIEAKIKKVNEKVSEVYGEKSSYIGHLSSPKYNWVRTQLGESKWEEVVDLYTQKLTEYQKFLERTKGLDEWSSEYMAEKSAYDELVKKNFDNKDVFKEAIKLENEFKNSTNKEIINLKFLTDLWNVYIDEGASGLYRKYKNMLESAETNHALNELYRNQDIEKYRYQKAQMARFSKDYFKREFPHTYDYIRKTYDKDKLANIFSAMQDLYGRQTKGELLKFARKRNVYDKAFIKDYDIAKELESKLLAEQEAKTLSTTKPNSDTPNANDNDIIDLIETSPQKGLDLPIIGEERLSGEVVDYLAKNNKKVAIESINGESLGMKYPNDTKRTLQGSEIKHTLKAHGDSAIEESRGQIAITLEDIANYPNIVKNADEAITSTTDRGLEAIVSFKQINGYYVVVEEVRPKANELAFKTMRKNRGDYKNDIAYKRELPSDLSVTSTASNNSLDKIIPQNPKDSTQRLQDSIIKSTPNSTTYKYDEWETTITHNGDKVDFEIKDTETGKIVKHTQNKESGERIEARLRGFIIEGNTKHNPSLVPYEKLPKTYTFNGKTYKKASKGEYVNLIKRDIKQLKELIGSIEKEVDLGRQQRQENLKLARKLKVYLQRNKAMDRWHPVDAHKENIFGELPIKNQISRLKEKASKLEINEYKYKLAQNEQLLKEVESGKETRFLIELDKEGSFIPTSQTQQLKFSHFVDLKARDRFELRLAEKANKEGLESVARDYLEESNPAKFKRMESFFIENADKLLPAYSALGRDDAYGYFMLRLANFANISIDEFVLFETKRSVKRGGRKDFDELIKSGKSEEEAYKEIVKRYKENNPDLFNFFDNARKNLESAFNITPIKEFGENYAEFYHDGVNAIKKLLNEKQGQVSGAFYRQELGDIDLVWGDSNFGLKHILDKHGKEFGEFGEGEAGIQNAINEIVKNGNIKIDDNARATLEYTTNQGKVYKVGLKQNWKGEPTANKWIVTAYDDVREADKIINSSGLTKGETLPLNSNESIAKNLNQTQSNIKDKNKELLQRLFKVDSLEQDFFLKTPKATESIFNNGILIKGEKLSANDLQDKIAFLNLSKAIIENADALIKQSEDSYSFVYDAFDNIRYVLSVAKNENGEWLLTSKTPLKTNKTIKEISEGRELIHTKTQEQKTFENFINDYAYVWSDLKNIDGTINPKYKIIWESMGDDKMREYMKLVLKGENLTEPQKLAKEALDKEFAEAKKQAEATLAKLQEEKYKHLKPQQTYEDNELIVRISHGAKKTTIKQTDKATGETKINVLPKDEGLSYHLGAENRFNPPKQDVKVDIKAEIEELLKRGREPISYGEVRADREIIDDIKKDVGREADRIIRRIQGEHNEHIRHRDHPEYIGRTGLGTDQIRRYDEKHALDFEIFMENYGKFLKEENGKSVVTDRIGLLQGEISGRTSFGGYLTELDFFRRSLEGYIWDNTDKKYNVIREFGTNYAEFYHDGANAIKKLLNEKQGQVSGAFYRQELGDIDLVWGDSSKGIQHILERRKSDYVKQGFSESEAISKANEFIESLPQIVESGVLKMGESRAFIRNSDNSVVIALDYKGEGDRKWVITAYENTTAPNPPHSQQTRHNTDTSSDVRASGDSGDIIPQNLKDSPVDKIDSTQPLELQEPSKKELVDFLNGYSMREQGWLKKHIADVFDVLKERINRERPIGARGELKSFSNDEMNALMLEKYPTNELLFQGIAKAMKLNDIENDGVDKILPYVKRKLKNKDEIRAWEIILDNNIDINLKRAIANYNPLGAFGAENITNSLKTIKTLKDEVSLLDETQMINKQSIDKDSDLVNKELEPLEPVEPLKVQEFLKHYNQREQGNIVSLLNNTAFELKKIIENETNKRFSFTMEANQAVFREFFNSNENLRNGIAKAYKFNSIDEILPHIKKLKNKDEIKAWNIILDSNIDINLKRGIIEHIDSAYSITEAIRDTKNFVFKIEKQKLLDTIGTNGIAKEYLYDVKGRNKTISNIVDNDDESRFFPHLEVANQHSFESHYKKLRLLSLSNITKDEFIKLEAKDIIDSNRYKINEYYNHLKSKGELKNESLESIAKEQAEKVYTQILSFRSNLEKALNINPIKEFGENYAEFYHDGANAIKKLLNEKQGQVSGAFYRDELGDIDLVWGEVGSGKSDGFGLSKIAKYHPEILEKLDSVIKNGEIVKDAQGRTNIVLGNDIVGLRNNWKGENTNEWIITAYSKKEDSPKFIDSRQANATREGFSPSNPQGDSTTKEIENANDSAVDLQNPPQVQSTEIPPAPAQAIQVPENLKHNKEIIRILSDIEARNRTIDTYKNLAPKANSDKGRIYAENKAKEFQELKNELEAELQAKIKELESKGIATPKAESTKSTEPTEPQTPNTINKIDVDSLDLDNIPSLSKEESDKLYDETINLIRERNAATGEYEKKIDGLIRNGLAKLDGKGGVEYTNAQSYNQIAPLIQKRDELEKLIKSKKTIQELNKLNLPLDLEYWTKRDIYKLALRYKKILDEGEAEGYIITRKGHGLKLKPEFQYRTRAEMQQVANKLFPIARKYHYLKEKLGTTIKELPTDSKPIPTLDLQKEADYKEVIKFFNKHETDQEQKELFEKILPIAKRLGVKVRTAVNTFNDVVMSDEERKKIAGAYFPLMNLSVVKKSTPTERKSKTLLHELLHSVTSRALDKPEILNPIQKRAVNDLNAIYNELKSSTEYAKKQEGLRAFSAGDYGLKNVHEMIAELSNPEFRQKLKAVNLFERVIDAITRLFAFSKDILLNRAAKAGKTGEIVESNAYERIKKAVYDIVDNYDDDFTFKYENSGRIKDETIAAMNANSGYSGWSRSRNSSWAIEHFEMPLSLFNRERMNRLINEIDKYKSDLEDNGVSVEKAKEILKNTSVVDFRESAKKAGRASWHHTGIDFKETDHYSFIDAIAEIAQNGVTKAPKIKAEKLKSEGIGLAVIKEYTGKYPNTRFIGYKTIIGEIKGSWIIEANGTKHNVNANKLIVYTDYKDHTELRKELRENNYSTEHNKKDSSLQRSTEVKRLIGEYLKNKLPKAEPIKKFGVNYSEYYHDGVNAIKKLLNEKQGQVSGAFYRDELGDIDLVWGDSNFGLKHILDKHPQVADEIPNIVKNGELRTENNINTIIFDNGKNTYRIGLSKGWDRKGDNNWIITAYEIDKPVSPRPDVLPSNELTKGDGTNLHPKDTSGEIIAKNGDDSKKAK